jgi:hypothetical protein
MLSSESEQVLKAKEWLLECTLFTATLAVRYATKLCFLGKASQWIWTIRTPLKTDSFTSLLLSDLQQNYDLIQK